MLATDLTNIKAICRGWKSRVYASGHSMTDLATAAGITKSYLSLIVRTGKPSVEVLERVETILQAWEQEKLAANQ